MTFDINVLITLYLHKMINGKEIPWYWCFTVMMVVENTFFFKLQGLQHIFSVIDYTKVIKKYNYVEPYIHTMLNQNALNYTHTDIKLFDMEGY